MTERLLLAAAALALAGCIDGVNQVAGVGAVYTTRCSADMDVEDHTYHARCTPESCETGFHSGPVSQVVVALDPGRKVVGFAERVCIQDLSQATTLFQPAIEAEEERKAAEDAGTDAGED